MMQIKAKKIDYDIQVNLCKFDNGLYIVDICNFGTNESVNLFESPDAQHAERFYNNFLELIYRAHDPIKSPE